MPKPAHDNKTKLVRAVLWSLGKDKPAPGDVQQTVLANCALASILAALANTASGRSRIAALVEEHAGAVVTDLSDVLSELAEPPKEGNKITSYRTFTVSLGKKGSTEATDVFYTDEGDHDSWSMIYMDSPNHHLWPCVIEKAYAVLQGNDYEKLNAFEIDGQKPYLPAEEVWKDLVGNDPDILEIKKDTDLSKIKAAAAAARQIPTIAASGDSAKKVAGWHGYTVLELSGSAITLYDPEQAKKITVSLADFPSNFKAILSGNP